MKLSFFAAFFLPQFLAVIVHVSFAQESDCTCDNIDSVAERFFVPEVDTPLDQDCLNDISDERLQSVQMSAEPRLVVWSTITFRT